MAETGTFSALIDEVRTRSARRDRIADVIAYVRSTIRECTVLALFEQNLVEVQTTVTSLPHIWERPFRLRTMLAVKYPYFDRRGQAVYPKKLEPGEVKSTDQYYFYISGNSYIFAGLAVGDIIDLAYSAYAPKFHYYETVGERPATFDDETETWSYLDAWDDNAALKQQAEDKVTNWLVFHWYDMIIEGALAKLFKQVNDERSKTSFALYKSQQKDLLAGEAKLFIGE